MFKKILLGALLFLAAYQTQAQHIWAESSEGFDPTYNPSNIIKDSEGTLYMSGVTLDIVTDEYSTKFFKSDNNGENWEEVAFMGIENTDVFHTMTFANEDLMLLGSAENGSGLQELLEKHVLVGVLTGEDLEQPDPAKLRIFHCKIHQRGNDVVNRPLAAIHGGTIIFGYAKYGLGKVLTHPFNRRLDQVLAGFEVLVGGSAVHAGEMGNLRQAQAVGAIGR